MNNRVLLICLAVFFILYALFALTNIKVVWGDIAMGIAALVAGVVCAFYALAGWRSTPPG